MLAESFVGILKFRARPNFSVPPPERQAADRWQQGKTVHLDTVWKVIGGLSREIGYEKLVETWKVNASRICFVWTALRWLFRKLNQGGQLSDLTERSKRYLRKVKKNWISHWYFFYFSGWKFKSCATKYIDKLSVPTVSNVTDRGEAVKRPDHKQKKE